MVGSDPIPYPQLISAEISEMLVLACFFLRPLARGAYALFNSWEGG